MTDTERDIRAALLRALHAAKGPMPETALKQHLRNVFAHVAFTELELHDHIIACETANLVAGINDEIGGALWDLTPKGKIRAQQLR